MTRSSIILVLSTSMLLASCSRDDVPFGRAGQKISFAIATEGSSEKSVGEKAFAMSDSTGTAILEVEYETQGMDLPLGLREKLWKDTKATLVTEADSMSAGFGVYVHDGSKYVIDGELVTKGTDGVWTTEEAHPFKKDKEYSILGYYPSTIAVNKSTGVFDYQVGSSSSGTQDVMLSYFNGTLDDGEATLQFCHAMTAVRFVWGSVDFATKIKSITISGVHSSATCTPNLSASPITFTWGNFSSTKQNVTGSKLMNVPAAETTITDDSYTFILIPQNLATDNVTISLTITDGTNDITVSRALTSGEWLPGKVNKYKLNFIDSFEYFIEEIPAVETSHEGSSSSSFTVKSYKRSKTAPYEESAQPWTLEYYNGSSWVSTKPSSGSWALVSSVTKTSGDGGKSGESVGLTLAAQSGVDTTIQAGYHQILLQQRTEKGIKEASGESGASLYDLSYDNPATNTRSATRNTANCYIVGAPGYYRIPAVYGNAIKNGESNEDAYNPGTTSSSPVLSTFIKHDNAAISNPWIASNSINIQEAFVVWQDSENLVTNPRICQIYDTAEGETKCFIGFDVNKKTIKPGNCIIAATNGTDIVWSWHIWVTDEFMSSTYHIPTTTGNHTSGYNLMPAPIGWVYSGSTSATIYRERSVRMRINNGRVTKEISVIQSPFMSAPRSGKGRCPFYQYGRKDPICPSTGSFPTQSHCQAYGPDEYKPDFESAEIINSYIQNRTIGYSIKHPNQFMGACSNYSDGGGWLYNQGDWCQEKYFNRWSAFNTVPDSDTVNDEKVEKTVYDPSPVGFKVPNLYAFKYFVDNFWLVSWNAGEQCATFDGKAFFPATGYVGAYSYESDRTFGKVLGYQSGYIEVHYYSSRSAGERYNKFFGISSSDDSSITAYPDGVFFSSFFKTIGGVIRPIKEDD